MPRYRQASEIGAFVYCHRAWWLRHGLGLGLGNAAARDRGTRAHAELGGELRRAGQLQRLALILILIAAGLLIVGLLR
ncbi:MAG: hypothetical protein H6648_11485 [Caldilineae bacterium]|nr:hypothetical protein [Chloroflexota bacterium]MCB9177767.1 hypothetical protein [Caldilineae bacterium]